MIAVTGASGFVGGHLVRAAVSAGQLVSGLVRSERAAARVRESGGRPLTLAEEPEALARSLEGCRSVVHLAQIGAERNGRSYEAVNVGLTRRVVEAARRAGVTRLVLFSGLGVARYGQSRRVTNRYFLSKLEAEALALGSGLDVAVFRPSYVLGPGDGFVSSTLRAMEGGDVEVPGDGSYRMQPIAVADAVELVLATLARPAGGFPTVFDLVGPEALSYARLVERLAAVARGLGLPARLRVRPVAIEEAERRSRSAAGYLGMGPDELDCLLCDEVGEAGPLEALLGRPLTPLDDLLRAALPGGEDGGVVLESSRQPQ
jgi:nucleoside-diphosphate-sugar epimerase